MNITVIKEKEALTSVWSGGVSKQYYIFPAAASYSNRDFYFRISVAVAATGDEAPYTNLPGITRHLIMLAGVAHVIHQDRYELVMHPYREIDVFDGGWVTSGQGKVTDLNLMVAGGSHGKMTIVNRAGTIPVAASCETCQDQCSHMALFCGGGSASLAFSTGEIYRISCGDLLLVQASESGSHADITLDTCKLIRMDVCCK